MDKKVSYLLYNKVGYTQLRPLDLMGCVKINVVFNLTNKFETTNK